MTNLIVATAIAALVIIERIPALRFRPLPLLRPYFATDAICMATTAIGLGLALQRWVGGLAGAGAAFWMALPFPVVALLALVLYDLGAYLTHLSLHRFEMLWRFHKVHHSSRALDWLATFRAHAVEHTLRHAASSVSLILAGVPLSTVALAAATYTAWAAFNHSNFRPTLHFLEPVLITPRLHRLHHVPSTSLNNLGTVFSFWDRLLGRLATARTAALEPLGVPGEVESYPQTWLPQLVEPFRSVEIAHQLEEPHQVVAGD